MTPAERQEFDALKQLVGQHAEQLKALERIEIAPESGGGLGVYARDNVIITLNGLTPTPT